MQVRRSNRFSARSSANFSIFIIHANPACFCMRFRLDVCAYNACKQIYVHMSVLPYIYCTYDVHALVLNWDATLLLAPFPTLRDQHEGGELGWLFQFQHQIVIPSSQNLSKSKIGRYRSKAIALKKLGDATQFARNAPLIPNMSAIHHACIQNMIIHSLHTNRAKIL